MSLKQTEIIFTTEFEKFNDYLDTFEKIVVIVDEKLEGILDYIAFDDAILIDGSEESKSLEVYNNIVQTLNDYEMPRNGIIVGIGGGVTTDVAGFVAATYKRGTNLALVPTSMLAYDSAIGGKNGLNVGIKNNIGTIKEADVVYANIELLKTLPKEDYANGMVEHLKHYFLSNNKQIVSDKTLDMLQASIEFKQSIIAQDLNDHGIRRVLNFGHTIAHGLEMSLDIKHGFAVANGILVALELSNIVLGTNHDLGKFKEVFELYGINKWVEIPDIKELVINDKKNDSEQITVILLEELGKPVIKQVDYDLIEQAIKKYNEIIK